MAQWVGQESGNTHDTRILDAERALAHAVAAIRPTPSPQDQKAFQSVVRIAERVLHARTGHLKAQLSYHRRWGVYRVNPTALKSMASLQAKLDGLQLGGVAGILAEFGAGDLPIVLKGRVSGE